MMMEGRVEAMGALYLKVENISLEKAMEALTLKGIFIGFTTKIKWFESTKGLGHLIQPKMSPNWLVNPTCPTN